MDWRSAFLNQARSDNDVRRHLNANKLAYCHQLHYLQMATEKLVKAYLTPAGAASPPKLSHAVFVRFLRVVKQNPDIRRRLGMGRDASRFGSYIDSLLPLANRVEGLAPSAAGTSQPNPEYRWLDLSTRAIIAPVAFPFDEFHASDAKMVKSH